jgi:ribonuclease HII
MVKRETRLCSFLHEQAILCQRPSAIVAGVDEAGRGPLAGPVVAAAAILSVTDLPVALADGLDDSKQLTPERREELYALMMACPHVVYGVGQADVAEIDAINILNATYRAMERAVAALPRAVDIALVDGNRAPNLSCTVHTLIGGDGLSLSIAAASIIAKVTRDRLMMALATEHPGYGWHTNMGYGTAEHYVGLNTLGVTPHHRRSFAPVRCILDGVAFELEPT